jgi:hypothetical protein
LVGTAFLYGRPGAVAPAGLGLLGPTGEKFRTTEAVKFVGSGGPVEIPLERDGFRDQVREARYMALSFVDDTLDVIPTGSPAVAENLPAWEANARVVLAGAKRWAQQRWGRS